MKRFFTLLFLFFTFSSFGQNLIPDPSAEDYVECPSSLGNIEVYTSSWMQFRGTPDYWNSCSTNIGLGWNNDVGYQMPASGNGYFGTVGHSTASTNSREYFGTQLTEPLLIGQEYILSFKITLAYRPSGSSRTACNNMGMLLMTENYLDSGETGDVVNFSHLRLIDILTDTTNWITISSSFVADSTYSFVSFGNFYSDENTLFEFPFEPDNAGVAYYYFDDFCITTNPNGCNNFLTITDNQYEAQLKIWPNPTESHLNYQSNQNFSVIRIMDFLGKMVYSEIVNPQKPERIEINLSKGIYLIEFSSSKEKAIERFVVQ